MTKQEILEKFINFKDCDFLKDYEQIIWLAEPGLYYEDNEAAVFKHSTKPNNYLWINGANCSCNGSWTEDVYDGGDFVLVNGIDAHNIIANWVVNLWNNMEVNDIYYDCHDGYSTEDFTNEVKALQKTTVDLYWQKRKGDIKND